MESQSEPRSGRGAAARRPFFRRRKSCPFSGPNAPKIDYKDVKLLQRFVHLLIEMPRRGERLGQALPHTGRLRTLARKQQRALHRSGVPNPPTVSRRSDVARS